MLAFGGTGKEAGRRLSPTGAWPKYAAALLVLAVLGLTVCSARFGASVGFVTDDCTHLEYSYQHGLRASPEKYLPWVAAARPVGRDAFTLLLRAFGEDDAAFQWAQLLLHLANGLLVWLALYRLTDGWWASLCGAAFFLLSASFYQPVYVPAVIFDLLSTTFLACLLLIAALVLRTRGRYRPWLLLLTLPLLLAAGKTKESALIVIVPLFALVLTDGGRGAPRQGGPLPAVDGGAGRLLRSRLWEVIWVASGTLLAAVMALTVVTDARGIRDPGHPYYSEYSFRVIGRSFGYFIATLFFNTDDPTPMRPPAAYIIIFFTLLAALLLRNRWMLLGLLWFVALLLPLAALKNHYALAYYPYPANIGAALFIAGLFRSLEGLLVRLNAPRRLAYLLPAAFVALLTHQSYSWLRVSDLPAWYDAIHARRAEVVRALKAAVPQPPPHSKIVLVTPETIHLDKNMSSFVRVLYRDPTLTCEQFADKREAERFVSDYCGGHVTLAVWGGGAAEVRNIPPCNRP